MDTCSRPSTAARVQQRRTGEVPRLTVAPSELRRSHDTTPAELLQAVRDGDADAWAGLVRKFDPSLRYIARSYRLAPDDVDDIVQGTWLELLKAVDRIHEPAAVGGWLRTVTRRTAQRSRQLRMREHLTDDIERHSRGDHGTLSESPEAILLAAERRAVLTAALATLPERSRRLVTVLVCEPTPDYRAVSEQFGMPIGSIGPTRARALARLARDKGLRAVSE